MNFKGRLAATISRFMAGRYGTDHYARFLSFCSLGLMLLSLLTQGIGEGGFSSLLFYAALGLLIWLYIRTFSRNISKRQAENQRYLRYENEVRSFFRLQRDRFQQRKDYVFFRCPGCRQVVRVPRKKGKIRITCRRCGYSFEKNT